MKFALPFRSEIIAIYDEESKSIPEQAVIVSDEDYEMLRSSKIGFSEFVFVDGSIIKGEDAKSRPELNQNPTQVLGQEQQAYTLEHLVSELIILLEMSNTVSRFSLSHDALNYIKVVNCDNNTFLNAFTWIAHEGMGGDLI